MESKVLLFDANDMKVGETFMRRARQLVNQQRAEWVDDSHNAIRFAPDENDWEKDAAPTATTSSVDADSKWIYALAEKRIGERRRFIRHSIGLIPGYLCTFILYAGFLDGFSWGVAHLFFGFLLGIWTTLYAIHAFIFAKTHLKGFRISDREERRRQRLALEVERLKRMGYRI